MIGGVWDSISNSGESAIYQAARNGKKRVVKFLLEEIGADPDIPEKAKGLTPAWVASLNGLLEVVKMLYDAGADMQKAPTKGEYRGMTPLAIALRNPYENPEKLYTKSLLIWQWESKHLTGLMLQRAAAPRAHRGLYGYVYMKN